MPDDSNILKIGAEFDVGPLVASAQQAGASFEQLVERLKASGLSSEEVASALTNLGATDVEVAAATGQLAAPTEAAAAEMQRLAGGSAMARVELGALTGSTGAVEFGLARLAGQSAAIAPLIQVAFAPFLVVAFAEIIENLAEKMATLYQNVVLDKEELDALNKIEATLIDTTARLAKETENAYIEYLKIVDPIEAAREKLRSLSDEHFEFKIDDKTLRAIPQVVTEAGLHYRDFIKSLTDFPASEIQQKMQDVATVIGLVQQRLAAPIMRGPLDRTELEGELKLLQTIQGTMQQFSDRQTNQSKVASEDIVKAQDEVAKKAEEAAKKEEEVAKKAADAAMKAWREQAEDQKKLQEDLAKATIPTGATGLEATGTELPNEALFADAQKKMADDAMASLNAIRDATAENGLQLDEILAKDLEFRVEEWDKANQKMIESTKKAGATIAEESKKLAEELSRNLSNAFDGLIRGTETARFAFTKFGGDLVLDAVHWTEQEISQYAAKEAMKLALTVTGQQAQTAATAAGTAQRESINEVALIRHLARDAEEVIVFVAKEVAQTAATIAAVAERTVIEAAAHEAAAARDASEAAMGAYAATSSIPIVGPILAPAAAAAAFAGVFAFDSAERGAIVPRNMPVNLHAGEMVLPQKISSAVQSMAAAGTGPGAGGNHQTNIAIHALDAASLRDMLSRNQRQFVGAVKGAIRNRNF